MGYVYAIAPDEPCTPYRVKIGMSRVSARYKRLKQHQTSSPVKLMLIWQVECVDAASAEAYLHAMLHQHHSHLEWFTFSSEQEALLAIQTAWDNPDRKALAA